VTLRDIFGMVRTAFASAVMFLAGAVIPVLGTAAMIFAPAPVLGYAVGFPRAMIRMAVVVILTAVLVGFGAGLPAAAAYTVTFGLAAAVMCYMLERQQPFERIVLCATASMAVAGTLGALAFAGTPATLAHQLHNELITGMMRGEKFYKTLGINAAVSADTQAMVADALVRLTPALLMIFGALSVLLNLGVFWRLSGKQRRVGYALFGDLVRWSAPEWLIWLLLVAGFGLFIPLAPLGTIALNIFICVLAVYFCQGLAIMAFYFKVLGMPRLARGLIYFVTVVQPVLAALVCVAGIFDMWIDFRRLKPPGREARNIGNFL
jgi:uncharacterized protein YybS (DUF2232 family)